MGGVKDVERLNQIEKRPMSELGSHHSKAIVGILIEGRDLCISGVVRSIRRIRAVSSDKRVVVDIDKLWPGASERVRGMARVASTVSVERVGNGQMPATWLCHVDRVWLAVMVWK